MTQEENMLSEADKQEFLDNLKKETLTRLAAAIELNQKGNYTEEAQHAKADACALLLVAIRSGVQFDPQDPIFQIFVKKPSWRNAMARACKYVCNPKSAGHRRLVKILQALPTFNLGIVSDNPGDLLKRIFSIFEKDGINPLEKDEVLNTDLWSDFYEDIPKTGGNGPSHSSNLMQSKNSLQSKLKAGLFKSKIKKALPQKIPHSKLQKYLSKKIAKNQQLVATHKKQSSAKVA